MIQSLDRAMTILSILEQKNTASVTEIAEELGVNKSTVSRLMETLKKHDMVQADPATKKYGLGFKILYLGEGVKRNINIITIARPFLTKLYDELDESVHLCAFNNDAAYVVDQVQSNKVYNLSATVGMAEPLHSSSVGKCIPPDSLYSQNNYRQGHSDGTAGNHTQPGLCSGRRRDSFRRQMYCRPYL